MIITERKTSAELEEGKGSDKEKPEAKYIAFATNRPKKDIERYSERWTIETGFEWSNERVRTAAEPPMDILLSLLEWSCSTRPTCKRRADMQPTPGGVYSRITQTDMKVII